MNLEPCPFCGAKAEMSFSAWQVRCTQCVCTGKTFRTKEQAIDWWNTRKARQPLTDEQVSIGSSIKDALEYALKVFEQLHNTQTYQGDNQDFSDEIITMRAALAELEQAQKQEPAQAVPAFWASENIFKESLRDNISCILTTTRCSANTVPLYTVPPAISEPAQAVPGKCEPVAEVLWYEPMLHEPQTKKGHKIIDASLSWMEKAPLGTKLYAAPPAIDEIRHRLILVCEYLETVGLMFVSPRVISSQIRAILEAGNGE